MAIPVGSKAPDFTLKSQGPEGQVEIKLSDNIGKRPTVLLFFPGAFTGVCTKEMCDVSNGLQSFGDAAVYGISVDSPFAQGAFAKQHGIQQPLLSDFSREVTRAYDVELPNFAGLGGSASKRAAFVIDAEGIIRYSEETLVPSDLPNLDAVRETVAQLG